MVNGNKEPGTYKDPVQSISDLRKALQDIQDAQDRADRSHESRVEYLEAGMKFCVLALITIAENTGRIADSIKAGQSSQHTRKI